MYSICAECGSQVLDLALHMKIHNDKRSFECEVCGKVAFGKKGFPNHQQTHKSWSCPKCQAVLPHNSRTMHLKKCAKEGQKEKELGCDKCSYVTTDKSNLNKHIKIHQKNKLEFSCVHIIFHHYQDYFDMTQKSMRFKTIRDFFFYKCRLHW